MSYAVRLKAVIAMLLLGAGVATSAAANAQSNYPNQPIRIVIGFAPGASLDAMARFMAGPMSEYLGQPVIVENRTGASGNLATEFVARAKPDGYTLLYSGSGGFVVNPATYATINYDPIKDFTHIGLVGTTDLMVIVNPSVPAKTVDEFVELTKKDPGRYKYGTNGAGNNYHLCIELFKQRTGARMEGVHYRGTGLLLPDLIANQVQISCAVPADVRSQIESGVVRGLFMMSKTRSSALPNVPTSAEMGYPELVRSGWWGFHAAHGMPQPVVDKLRAAIAKTLANPSVSEKLVAMGVDLVPETQAAFAKRIEDTLKSNQEVARTANIRIE
jgi:tripartite-type tricarboxylate transporter receptor subunit TctC